MKVQIKEHGEEEFQYGTQATINDVRAFAASKLGCEATSLNVRKRKESQQLAVTKTFEDLSIKEDDTLIVSTTTRNLQKMAANKVFAGKSKSSTKHDISQVMTQATKNHGQNLTHHEATHEQLEDMENKLENVHKDLKAGCSIEKSMPGESHNQSQSRLRAQKNKLCDLIKEHEEENKKKNARNLWIISKP